MNRLFSLTVLVALSGCGDNLERPSVHIGGTVEGARIGLTVILNGGEELRLSEDGPWAFSTELFESQDYSVAFGVIPDDPPVDCTLTNNEGTVSTEDIDDIEVICIDRPTETTTTTTTDPPDTYAVGGSTAGLLGSGLILGNNGADDLPVNQEGPFTFATELEDGDAYLVEVLGQPDQPSQTCSVSSGSGTIAGADVSDVSVDCITDQFSVGGDVVGIEGTGLILQLNGGDDLPIAADGPFTFATSLDDLTAWDVTVSTPPTLPTQECAINAGSGVLGGADVTTVQITCVTPTWDVGGVVVGLEGTGLVLENTVNGEQLPILADGPLVFPTGLPELDPYDVVVVGHPSQRVQQCHVEQGSGIMPGADVSSIVVECNSLGLYDNGDQWLDYVADDGPTAWQASDTVCDASNAGLGCTSCLHGGEIRRFVQAGETSCAGLSASDDQGAFDWICDDSSGEVQWISTNLQPGVELSDLVDFAGGSWRTMTLNVSDGGPVWSSVPMVWWDNPVSLANNGVAAGVAVPSSVYLVGANANGSFEIDVDHVAVVVAPGAILSATGSSAVHAVNGDFHWIQGDFDATGASYGVLLERSSCSQVRMSSVMGSSQAAFRIHDGSHSNQIVTAVVDGATRNAFEVNGGGSTSSENLLDGLISSSGGTAVVINRGPDTAMFDTVFDDHDDGISVLLSDGVVIDDTEVRLGTGVGIELDSCDDLSLTNALVEDYDNRGILLTDGARGLIGQTTISRAAVWGGLDTTDAVDWIFEDIVANNNGGHGIRIEGSSASGNVLRRASAWQNTQSGIRIGAGAADTTAVELYVADNGQAGLTVNGHRNSVSDVTSYNNGSEGIVVSDAVDTVLVGVLSAHNTDEGLYVSGSPGTFAAAISTVSNELDGIRVANSAVRPTLAKIASAWNGQNGLSLITVGHEGQAFDVASLENGVYGVSLNGGMSLAVQGTLTVGGNGAGTDCWTAAAASGVVTVTCDPEAPSSYVLLPSGGANAAFVGAVTSDDSVQPDDVSGLVTHDSIAQWASFENSYRGFGSDGVPAASPGLAACSSGENCRIWDFGLQSSDATLLDHRGVPTGNDVGVHLWDPSPDPTSQLDCDNSHPGSVFGGATCETTFLLDAVEISDDGIGDDDGLCSSGESCLWTPNLGAYQGHGSLVPQGFSPGVLTGITLWSWSANGL